MYGPGDGAPSTEHEPLGLERLLHGPVTSVEDDLLEFGRRARLQIERHLRSEDAGRPAAEGANVA